MPPGGLDLGVAGEGRRWGVRVGLQDVKGMSQTERERLLAAQPYSGIDDLRRRGGISRPTAEALVKAGALDRLAGVGPTQRRRLLLEVGERWGSGSRRAPKVSRAASGGTVRPEQTRLDLDADHRPQLPEASLADAVRDELAVLGLDITRHVVTFYEPLLPVLGVARAHMLDPEHPDAPADGKRIRVAGVRVALQSPPVRSGQRVLFLSLDDRSGTVQCNFFERVLEETAWTVMNSWLVVVEGRIRRSGARGRTVIAERAWDLTELWRAWRDGRLREELAAHGPPRLAERRPSDPEGLSAAMFASGSRR